MNTHRVLGMALALCAPGAAHSACSAQDQAALEKFDRDWGAAADRGDRAALEAIYAADYIDLQPGASVDRDATLKAIADDVAKLQASGHPAPDLHHDFYQIQCTPRSALITHRNRGVDDGTRWQTRSVHQLEKIDGRWVVVGNATHPASESMQVGWLDLEWNVAELAADQAWFERNLADDYFGVTSRTGEREDKAAVLAGLGKQKLTVAETTDMETSISGDTARVTGIYHTRGTGEDGKAFDRRTRYIDTFVKRDGRWQVWSSQGTLMPD